MPAREIDSHLETRVQRDIRIHSDISEEAQKIIGIEELSSLDTPSRTLSPISFNAMNKLHSSSPSSLKNGSTIRSIPPDPIHIDTLSLNSAEDPRRVQNKSDPMPYSSIKQSNHVPTVTTQTHSQTPLAKPNGIVRTISAEFRTHTTTTSTSTSTSPNPSEDFNTLLPNTNGSGSTQWSSAVGRANLGKSGRVIERLMGENDMLKRDLKLEALRAEESKIAVKMIESKMEAMSSDYETKLNDAAINRTMLKRRERQLMDLKNQIDGERSRADRAEESEKGWRAAMEEVERESKRKVEEAQTYAALMEGRNKAMASHWRDQGVEVSKTVGKLGKEIDSLVEERRQDDERMNMLQGLCEQQKEELGKLTAEKEGIGLAFERYKEAQDQLLKDIKAKAKEQERKNEELLEESQKVLKELKWALGVKKNVRDAQ